jgi:hypothetical protein
MLCPLLLLWPLQVTTWKGHPVLPLHKEEGHGAASCQQQTSPAWAPGREEENW